MFSVGPCNPLAGYPTRIYPSNPPSFAKAWDDYYEALSLLADSLLEAFALALQLPEDYFKQFTDHHASALRALNYPSVEGCNRPKNQYRASAHTDYGILTILRSDGPGLQVSKDKNPPTWHDAPVVEDGFIVNLGDLMKRWTNDRWLSTLHQVVMTPSEFSSTEVNVAGVNGEGYCKNMTARRQSMAFFYNVNKDAVISNLHPEDQESKYEAIVAGDFLMAKHLAATGAVASK
jgi:isopenicillin N synthase-like dioxygenase